MTKINTGLLYHWYDGDNYDIDCDDDYITCMVVINLQHQTGPEAWNRGISWLIWLIIGLPPRATIHDNSEYFLTTETRPHFCFQSKREAEKGQLGGRGDNDNGQFQGNFPLQRPVIQACGRLRPLGSKDLDQAKCQKRLKATKTGAKCQKCKKTQEIIAIRDKVAPPAHHPHCDKVKYLHVSWSTLIFEQKKSRF